MVSLVAVHPSSVSTLGKQLLPKTFGHPNVSIAQQVVRPRSWFGVSWGLEGQQAAGVVLTHMAYCSFAF